jgi:hypothetical protein
MVKPALIPKRGNLEGSKIRSSERERASAMGP